MYTPIKCSWGITSRFKGIAEIHDFQFFEFLSTKKWKNVVGGLTNVVCHIMTRRLKKNLPTLLKFWKILTKNPRRKNSSVQKFRVRTSFIMAQLLCSWVKISQGITLCMWQSCKVRLCLWISDYVKMRFWRISISRLFRRFSWSKYQGRMLQSLPISSAIFLGSDS